MDGNARGTKGELIEAVFDVDLIGRGPYSIDEGGTIRGDKKFAVLGTSVDKSKLAGPRATKTRHLRAYRV